MRFSVSMCFIFTSVLFLVEVLLAESNIEIFERRAEVLLHDIKVLKNAVQRNLNISESIKDAIPAYYQKVTSIVLKNDRLNKTEAFLARKASVGYNVTGCYEDINRKLFQFIVKAKQKFRDLVEKELGNIEIELKRSNEILSRVEDALTNNLRSELRRCLKGEACMIMGEYEDDLKDQFIVIDSLKTRVLALMYDIFQDFEWVAVSPSIKEEVLDYAAQCLHR